MPVRNRVSISLLFKKVYILRLKIIALIFLDIYLGSLIYKQKSTSRQIFSILELSYLLLYINNSLRFILL